MSTARHQAEWLSLVEASGSFLSLPVLLKAFPAGVDAHDPEHLKRLRSAYEGQAASICGRLRAQLEARVSFASVLDTPNCSPNTSMVWFTSMSRCCI